MVVRRNIGLESPGVCVAVVKKDPDGWKFLCLKRSETESYGGYWGFVTGGMREKERVAHAVIREMKEELGFGPQSMWATEYIIQFFEPENDKIWMLPLIAAVVPENSEVVLSDENSEFRWLLPNKAKHLLTWKNLIRAVDDINEELSIFPARNWAEITA